MSSRSRSINEQIIKSFLDNPKKQRTLDIIKRVYLPAYFKRLHSLNSQNKRVEILKHLDLIMQDTKDDFMKYGAEFSGINHINWVKSNTGKTWEKFICLALCCALLETDYVCAPFRNEFLKLANLTRKDFEVSISKNGHTFPTPIDSDLICFNPTRQTTIYLLSIKSSPRDRFHNVAFWQLLKDNHNIQIHNPEVLKKCKYVAITGDLSADQPDFASEPRNLICLDAAILDYAFVIRSDAEGEWLGTQYEDNTIFHELPVFVDLLKNGK